MSIPATKLVELDEAKRRNDQITALIVKSNDLIRHSRSEFSSSENRLINYMCSKLPPLIRTDEDAYVIPSDIPTTYQMSVKQYAVDSQISLNGELYKETRKAIKHLRDYSFEYMDEEGVIKPIFWLADYEVDEGTFCENGSGAIKYEIGKNIIPFLYREKDFTRTQWFETRNLAKCKKKNAIPLFEFLSSYSYLHKVEISFDDLKYMLKLEDEKSYRKYNEFNRSVLKPIVDQINAWTSLIVTYKRVREHDSIFFSIYRKGNKEMLEKGLF